MNLLFQQGFQGKGCTSADCGIIPGRARLFGCRRCNSTRTHSLRMLLMGFLRMLQYAQWEESQKDFRRARSVWERAIDVDYTNVTFWLKVGVSGSGLMWLVW